MISIPILVNRSLGSSRFGPRFKAIVIVGGLLWIAYGLFLRDLVQEELLGVERVDELLHLEAAQNVARDIRLGDSDAVMDHLVLGNYAFQVLLGMILFLTGGSGHLICATSGWLGFCGGLTLLRSFAGSMLSTVDRIPNWLSLIVFLPTTVFWCSMPLKEGLMFWAICQFFVLFPLLNSNLSFKPSVTSIIGCFIVIAGRPYVAIIILMSVLPVIALFSGRAKGTFIALLVIPICVLALEQQTGVGLDFQQMTVYGDLRAQGSLRESAAFAGSNLNYGEGVQQFFIGGLVSLFFRPFLWEVRNIRSLIGSVETWGMTILILWGWFRIPVRQRLGLASQPNVLMAGIQCILFCFLLTYLTNEGLVARARVQAMPALITLMVVPLLHVRLKNQAIKHNQPSAFLRKP